MQKDSYNQLHKGKKDKYMYILQRTYWTANKITNIMTKLNENTT